MLLKKNTAASTAGKDHQHPETQADHDKNENGYIVIQHWHVSTENYAAFRTRAQPTRHFMVACRSLSINVPEMVK